MARAVDRIGLSNDSIWTATTTAESFPSLTSDLATDVCVVGAGIAGMSIAYELARAGKDVVVLESMRVGGGMTSMTTAHLTTAVDDRYFEMEQLHGRDTTRKIAAAHSAAIDRIEAIVRQERIVCGFARLDGFLTLGREHDVDVLERELAAARHAGLLEVQLERHLVYPARGSEPCLRFPRQARFHPLQYLHGLSDAITRAGAQIFCRTHVEDVNRDRDAGGVSVRAGSLVVRAEAVVLATNSPISERVAIHTKQTPSTTYVISAPFLGTGLRDMLAWDTEDPYHYVRVQHVNGRSNRGGPQGDYLIIGGEDHNTGQEFNAQDRFARLVDWARERFPTMGDVEYAWSGEIMESADRLAFIGQSPSQEKGVYLVTGESGVGITHGTIAAGIITDLISGRPNELVDVYEPARLSHG